VEKSSLPFTRNDPVELFGNAPVDTDGARPGTFTVHLGALSAAVLHFPERR